MVAVILATAFQLAVPDCSSVFSSYARGRRWDFTITVAALEKAPTWREDEASPPLSPRDAISIAARQLGTFVRDSEHWRLTALTLQPLAGDGNWIYVVRYAEPLPQEGVGSFSGGWFEIPVLMDGRTVTPTEQRWPAQ